MLHSGKWGKNKAAVPTKELKHLTHLGPSGPISAPLFKEFNRADDTLKKKDIIIPKNCSQDNNLHLWFVRESLYKLGRFLIYIPLLFEDIQVLVMPRQCL